MAFLAANFEHVEKHLLFHVSVDNSKFCFVLAIGAPGLGIYALSAVMRLAVVAFAQVAEYASAFRADESGLLLLGKIRNISIFNLRDVDYL